MKLWMYYLVRPYNITIHLVMFLNNYHCILLNCNLHHYINTFYISYLCFIKFIYSITKESTIFKRYLFIISISIYCCMCCKCDCFLFLIDMHLCNHINLALIFLMSYLAAPKPTLDHYWIENLTYATLISAFLQIQTKDYQNSLKKVWSQSWADRTLKQEPSLTQ